MSSSPDHAGEVAWPPERLLWAVIEPSGAGPIAWKRDGEIPPGLLVDVADQVPVPVEDLHAVGAAAGDGRLVVCAARRIELVALHAEGRASSLVPAAIPPEIVGAGELDPRRLNLLVGAFEPIVLRRARTRRHWFAAAAVLLLAGLSTLGLWRREHSARETTRRVQSASERILSDLGLKDGGTAQLITELEQRRRVSGIDLASRRSPDAAAALNLVLSAWPAGTQAKPQTLSLGPEGAALSVLVPPPGDAAAFLSSLRPIEGWTLDEPRLTSVGAETRLTLRMRPKVVPPSGGHP